MADVFWGVAPVTLSKEEWKKIKGTIDLPNEAKREIEGVLAFFRYMQSGSAQQPRAGATRKRLQKIGKLADDLLAQIIGHDPHVRDRLSRLTESQLSGVPSVDDLALIFSRVRPDILRALTDVPRGPHSGPTPRHDAIKLLLKRCWSVERLRGWAANAAQTLPSEASGAHKRAENNQFLVAQLDPILFRHRNIHVTRSYKAPEIKNFVKVCFNIADPAVGAGSIDEAMKAYIKSKSARGEIMDDERK
jgi:hypothetical protein